MNRTKLQKSGIRFEKDFLKMLVAIGLVFSATACQTDTSHKTAIAFYHWKTELKLSDFEKTKLDSAGVKKLYVRFFDLDWDFETGQAIPIATVEMDTAGLADFQIVPTVFITNRTFLQLPPDQTAELAEKVFLKIEKISDGNSISEIQFDCDWSEQSRAVYFSFLENFKKLLVQNQKATFLSATIRLHQVKYFEKTGVPPVERGMLMYYNMGEVENPATKNSILDLETASTYLQNFEKYPLVLDVALPLFSWAVVYRDEKLVHLIHGLTEKDLTDAGRFKKTEPTHFLVNQNTYLGGYYLYAGDVLRLESADQALLNAAALQLKKVLPSADRTLTFYHLDSIYLEQFTSADLKKILGHF